MEWDRLGGSWRRLKGRLRERLGTLTHDPENIEAGRLEQLIGEVQERENISAEEAERRLSERRGPQSPG
jgi:uncharacterized protein YjbJ (UPF0337 family)